MNKTAMITAMLVGCAWSVTLKSDPICNSAGCTQYLHPKSDADDFKKNYYVPNFGVDHEIEQNHRSLKIAED